MDKREPFERLQEARLDAGFKEATEAARHFGWNENTYRSHDNGERGISRKGTADRYASAYKVNIEWLVYGRGPKNKNGDNNKTIYTILDDLHDRLGKEPVANSLIQALRTYVEKAKA